MSDSKKKRYIKASTKCRTFEEGGEIINLNLNLADLQTLPIDKGGYVKISLSKRKTPDEYGNTHAVYENDWKPSEDYKGGKEPKISKGASYKPAAPKEDLPF